MSDLYTTNYGLTKPDVGASDDTWGEKLNANFDIIDDAISRTKGDKGDTGDTGAMGPSGVNIKMQDTAPSNPVPGDMWWDSDSGNTYIYYFDGNSSQWVQQNTVFDTIVGSGDVSGLSEAIDDRVAALFIPGANITLTYNDLANTLTVASTGGGGGGGIPEPTDDGLTYGRKTGTRTQVLMATGDVVDGGNF